MGGDGPGGGTSPRNLTAEAIYDRTRSTQLRRLSNRRFLWYHVLLFVSLGFTIGVGVVTGVFLAGGSHAAPATDHPPALVPTNPGAVGGAQSGPITHAPDPGDAKRGSGRVRLLRG